MRPSREEPSGSPHTPRDTRRVGRKEVGHGGREGQAGGENVKESLRIQGVRRGAPSLWSAAARGKWGSLFFVLSKVWLLESHQQQNPEPSLTFTQRDHRCVCECVQTHEHLCVYVHVCSESLFGD